MPPIPSYFCKIRRRCAFPLSAIPLPPKDALRLIKRIPGLQILNDNYQTRTLVTECLPSFAKQYVGVSRYARNAHIDGAPLYVNCSSFMAFVYAQMGIKLPRLAVQQSEVGELVSQENLTVGDLVFTTGHINRYRDDPAQSVGHVAMLVGPSQYIHAHTSGVTLVKASHLYKNREFRVARRYISQTDCVVLLSCDTQLNIETSDDIYWLLTKYL